ncbi:succinate CoA transferase [Phocaeicola salanitronis DSM 18170]|uniref:Succinate CoA transferase n=1 Tax=Phocaeicola salanitronis (strain DSM 18170 / JCM 13657 / CCUG 60908 / BL78) TaxID=667015 RepID=F0R8R3_PHOSB|nr:succinate CoA transferase [Phocaeicola salanitronis]ADY35998.1 succinate CoA transferase [Phocaeicola salanitronis DSM 18170]
MKYPILSAEEAAALIIDGQTVGIGGFSSVGTPKAVPAALAQHAETLHNEGKPFKIGLITGGATGNQVDSALTEAHAVAFRTPFQSNKEMRNAINSGEVQYFDLHLSQIGQDVRYGFLGKIDVAIIEASGITPEGDLILSTSVGISPTLTCVADKIIIELNEAHAGKLTGMHDIFVLDNPPYRREIPIYKVNDRTGSISVKVDSKKVAGVVLTNERDQIAAFTPLNETTRQIGQNVADFLVKEYRQGAIPKEFLPLQSGVGNIANAVLGALGGDPHLPAFSMYTEVIQNSVIDLMLEERIRFVAGSSLTLSDDKLDLLYEHIGEMKDRVLLRPQEITNHPEVIRRLGIIAVNTALEADIFGNVNSTHVSGSKMMNGIGGSGDFARNAYLSIFTTPSTAKGGLISSIVPQVSHVDSTEHDVRILVTEQGVADLRGKSPLQRARLIIENCAHPDYKELLWDYLKLSEGHCHTPMSLRNAFQMHLAFAETGDMRNTKYV